MTKHHAHSLVAETARDMAEALYEDWARDDVFYKRFKGKRGRAIFVTKVTPRLLPDARSILARMLTMDRPEREKEEIYEALLMDNALVYGRHRPLTD